MWKWREPLIDPVKLRNLAFISGCADEQLQKVCADLTDGANIGCLGAARSPSMSKNTSSAFMYGEHVTDALASWIKKGFVYGPVDASEIPHNAKVNGILCRPKPDGSVRVILNMSAPAGASVNDGIDIGDFPAVMSSTKKWLQVLEHAGIGCYMVKVDWADAYKHIQVREQDLDLQWFTWLGKGFVELCLIFGTASSVGIYDRAAKVVLRIVIRVAQFPGKQICQHLDDVCAAGSLQEVRRFEQTYRDVAEQVGVRLAPTDDPEKAFSASQSGTVLGVHYNTKDWTWSIPQDKLVRFLCQIQEALEAEFLKQADVWSLCGRILHYAPLIPGGRFNLDQIIIANGISADRRYPVEIHSRLKRQLHFWLTMIRVCAQATKIPDPEDRLPIWALDVFTDAAGGSSAGIGSGCAAICGPWWAYAPWSWKINNGVRAADGNKLSRKLSALELVGPLICIASGFRWCKGLPLKVWVDNSGSVSIWRKGYSSHCGLCSTLVKAIATVAAGLGCRVSIEKIRRCSNTGAILADALSKADFQNFFRVADSAHWPVQTISAPISPPILAWIQNPLEDDDLGTRILNHISRHTPIPGYPL